MTTDFRALCAELADELTKFNAWYIEDNGYGLPALEALLRRSDAALAQSDEPAVPEGREPVAVTGQPSDADLHAMAFRFSQPCFDFEYIPFARAVLARWGNPAPQPPAEGEVAELVEWLYEQLHVCLQAPWTPGIKHFGRAAHLLQRQYPQPVLVSEGLPRPKDCDAEGRCWWFALETEVDFGAWTLGTPEACTGDNWGHTHWLPATALPLPEVGQ